MNARDEFAVDGNPDVDFSISTRELAHFIRQANIDFNNLPDMDFDRPLGESTGAASSSETPVVSLKLPCALLTNFTQARNSSRLDFNELRGMEWCQAGNHRL